MKYYKDNPAAVQRRNNIRGISERMIGGARALAALTVEARAELRKVSTNLYNAGRTAGKAEEFMQQSTAGFVYILRHPSWPDALKIGRACSPKGRLSSYNTGCPDRAYYLAEAMYFDDCQLAEGQAHDYFDSARLSGEWFSIKTKEAKAYITQLQETENVARTT